MPTGRFGSSLVQRAVVMLRDGTRADGLLECRSEPCIVAMSRMQSRPVDPGEVVEATLREQARAPVPSSGDQETRR